MKKIISFEIVGLYVLRCTFNNGVVRDLDISTFMDRKGKYSGKVFDEKIFRSVKLGELGQLYWDGIAEMKDIDGNIIPVEYDICPDFAYMNSVILSKIPC